MGVAYFLISETKKRTKQGTPYKNLKISDGSPNNSVDILNIESIDFIYKKSEVLNLNPECNFYI